MRRTPPELPTLNPGVTLLESDDRTTGAIQSLVLDRVLIESGDAVWIDAQGNGTTQPVARLAPSPRALRRIHVARAFTPWQHQSLIHDLEKEIGDDTVVVVLPAFDAFYRTDDVHQREARQMMSDGMAVVSEVATETGVPVLLTQQRSDKLSQPIADAADNVLACELTELGPRFRGDEFETLVYPIQDELVQTTLAFWSRVLSDRHPAAMESRSPTTGVSLSGSN